MLAAPLPVTAAVCRAVALAGRGDGFGDGLRSNPDGEPLLVTSDLKARGASDPLPNPVPMTVTLTPSLSLGSWTAPKMISASSPASS